jgi:hypothetical protein
LVTYSTFDHALHGRDPGTLSQALGMTQDAGGLRLVPLVFTMTYLVVTLILFAISPYEWGVRQWWVPYIYVPISFVLLTIGYLVASRKPVRLTTPAPVTFWYIAGALSIILLLAPSTRTYTGKWPWEFSLSFADQKDAYRTLQDQLANTAREARSPLIILRTITAPLAFSALPLAVIYWKSLRPLYKMLAVLVVLASIDFSVIRGTTRELADLLVIGASAFLVSLGRSSVVTGASLLGVLAKHRKALVLLPLTLLLVLTALIGRTEARTGGFSISCIADSSVCLSSSSEWSALPDSVFLGLATVSGYMSQGYYGLSLAAEKPFESTHGLGHSPAIGVLYVMLGGDPGYLTRTYTYRGRMDGWSEETQWSTLLVWIANDVGFGGALIFVLVLGYAWGRAWMNATKGMDDRSAIFFCALMMMLFYLPGQNQMMGTLDAYATLLFWGFAALFRPRLAPAR